MSIQQEFTQLLSLYNQEGKQGTVHFTLLEKSCDFFERLKSALLAHEISSAEAFSLLEALHAALPISAAKPSKDLPTPSCKERSRREEVLDRLTRLAHEIAQLLEPQGALSRASRAKQSTAASKLHARHKMGKRRWVRS